MKQETIKKILQFRDERDWKQFHNGKDLALSLSLEASELLEVYQWSGDDLFCLDKLDKIKEELADILMYSVLLSDCYNINLDEIINDKLQLNIKKYPVSKAKGKKEKYDEL